MDDQLQPLTLAPLTVKDLRDGTLNVATDTLQLQTDAINVLEGRVAMNTFSPDYQRKIENYYRFSSVSPSTIAGGMAQVAIKRVGKG